MVPGEKPSLEEGGGGAGAGETRCQYVPMIARAEQRTRSKRKARLPEMSKSLRDWDFSYRDCGVGFGSGFEDWENESGGRQNVTCGLVL